MPIERTPESRSLTVIIEILKTAERNRVDVHDFAMINFAFELVEKRLRNEQWGPIGKSAQPILFGELPPLGEPIRKEGDLIAWVVE